MCLPCNWTIDQDVAALEAGHESQTLRPVPLHAAGSGGPLRSPGGDARMCHLRPRAGDLYSKDPLETAMLNNSQHQHNPGKRCAVCDRKFGLIRYYSWRTALCSKKCVDHFKARRDIDDKWLWRFRAA